MKEVREIARRAGISEEEVLWVESLSQYQHDDEDWPDLIMDRLDEGP